MFTYNTMQTFLGVVGIEPLHMVSPASEDPKGLRNSRNNRWLFGKPNFEKHPKRHSQSGFIRNAVIVAMAVGGSTNVMLHAPEISRAAGYKSFFNEIMSPEEFNHLSNEVVPVLVNARPFGEYSMVDIDEKGGIQVFVRDLLDAGLINGDVITCTGSTLSKQVENLRPPKPDGQVIFSVKTPFKQTGGLRLLGGNLSPDKSAVLKLAGVENGLENDTFHGIARVFDGNKAF